MIINILSSDYIQEYFPDLGMNNTLLEWEDEEINPNILHLYFLSIRKMCYILINGIIITGFSPVKNKVGSLPHHMRKNKLQMGWLLNWRAKQLASLNKVSIYVSINGWRVLQQNERSMTYRRSV